MKKGMLQHYLELVLGKEVAIKNYYKPIDELMEVMKNIHRVEFVAKDDLVSRAAGFFDIVDMEEDSFGLGVPEQFSLSLDFHSTRITENIINHLSKWADWRNARVLEKFVCVGKDDEGFETVYNVESFIRKWTIDVDKDDNWIYDQDTVRDNLVKKVDEYIK